MMMLLLLQVQVVDEVVVADVVFAVFPGCGQGVVVADVVFAVGAGCGRGVVVADVVVVGAGCGRGVVAQQEERGRLRRQSGRVHIVYLHHETGIFSENFG